MSFGELSDLMGRLDYEDDGWDEVQFELHDRQLNALPRPTCCQESRDYPAAIFQLSVYDGDSREAEGSWLAPLVKAFETQRLRRRDFNNPPEAKFCTYCGTALPEMKRKAEFPTYTCVVTDGGYYCDTCKERLHACRCLPPEHAWERA